MQSILRNWRFNLGDVPEAWYKGFDDSAWQYVTVPHDWSVTLPFSREYSSGTGYLAGGTGWYRAEFDLPESTRGKKVFIAFDGVYKNSQVWCNSNYLGKRPSGYASFCYDISDFAVFGGEINSIAVKVSHEDISDSRWFTGSGIYRKVTVTVKERVYIPEGGVFFSTPSVSRKHAEIKLVSTVTNDTGHSAKALVEHTMRFGGNSVCVMNQAAHIPPHSSVELEFSGTVEHPELWSCEQPALYSLETKVDATLPEVGLISSIEPPVCVGIREARFDADKGFFLNGMPMKIKGVCVHHDAGCLGAAVWPEVWRRRLEKLKAAGCNAIRMSHNPHMPELYDLCDEMGFLVMDEAFDEWEAAKNKWSRGHNVYPPVHQGYAADFHEWHERDLSGMIKLHRNHPCVIMWSIGNEIDYPNDPYCHPLFKQMAGNNDKSKPAEEMRYNANKPNAERLPVLAAGLCAIVKKHDTTRPVLAACAFPELSAQLGFMDSFDVIGYNYKEHLYAGAHRHFADKALIGSENNHGFTEWKAVRDNEYMSAQFLWTGIDYLGESRGEWPWHGSSSGLLDTAGFEKLDYFRRQAMWSEKPMVYLATRRETDVELLPRTLARSWDYMTGESIQVVCYTNLRKVELFVDDDSHGIQERGNDCECLVWTPPFKRGKLRAVNAEADCEAADLLESTLPPVRILLNRRNTATRNMPDSLRIEQIEVFAADEHGKLCTNDSSMISVTVSNAKLLGIENGDLSDVTEYSLSSRRLYKGRAIIYLLVDSQLTERTAEIEVCSEGMASARLQIK